MLLGWSLVAERPTSTSWAVQTLEWPSQDEPSHRLMTNACWFKIECRWVYYATHNQPIHLVCLDLVPEHIFESTYVITDLIWSAHGVLLDWCWVRRPQFLGLLLLPGWFLTTGLCLVPVFHQILFDICFDLIYKYWWRFRICNVQSSGDWPRIKASNWKKKASNWWVLPIHRTVITANAVTAVFPVLKQVTFGASEFVTDSTLSCRNTFYYSLQEKAHWPWCWMEKNHRCSW